jgi:hypothetical protein
MLAEVEVLVTLGLQQAALAVVDKEETLVEVLLILQGQEQLIAVAEEVVLEMNQIKEIQHQVRAVQVL